MKEYRIAVVAGDGIGPEVMAECKKVLTAAAELDGGFRQPDLWVNKRGERFCDESGAINSTFMGTAIARQPGHFALAILDTAQIRKYKDVSFMDILIKNKK